jgi:glyoxylase-like metal-dependent hydrolase (beta-lactamase superfamily II)
MSTPIIKAFHDRSSGTISYVVEDKETKKCAVIDSVLDFDMASGRTSTKNADLIIEYIAQKKLIIDWIIETHVHADHLSAAPYIQEKIGGKIGIGEEIILVQDTFGKIFNAGTEFERDGSQFDKLFKDNDIYTIGELNAKTIHTPGHTPACMVHVIEDTAFVGDTLFMPDGGTARADFPGGDARTLFRSIKKILNLPGETRLFICHDYGPGGREVAWETTVSEQRSNNIHVKVGISEDKFVEIREARDATLSMPKLIIPATQVNMRAGDLPEEEDNGVNYLKIPINKL